jgi:hypothetical protein
MIYAEAAFYGNFLRKDRKHVIFLLANALGYLRFMIQILFVFKALGPIVDFATNCCKLLCCIATLYEVCIYIIKTNQE